MSATAAPSNSMPADSALVNVDVIDGPRKRRPSEHVTENSDPLAQKRAKTAHSAMKASTKVAPAPTKAPPTKSSTTTHQASVEDLAEPTLPPRPQPRNPSHILEAADGRDDGVATSASDLPDLETVDTHDNDNKEEEEEGSDSKDDEAELSKIACLMKKWNTPVYAFFKPRPAIAYVEGRKVHVFECGASHCKCKTHAMQRYIDTGDVSSTSNLCWHATQCWGEEAIAAVQETCNLQGSQEVLSGIKEVNGSITAALERVGKEKVTYSHRQHTKAESRAEFVCWVVESKHPFQIAKDRGFCSLMKTGQLECYIPSPETIS
ncbi:hypothetical protein CVT26_002898 [Gymnopilus dilepis]|uniref:Uncharacterized protein n=1 Tax=Gymnopilus dilepis TaxID=231916 RepID=A0A409X1D7_9AGAR|nr:hypothetical protein CVT26_002898 [Gymnopilus dilepis]